MFAGSKFRKCVFPLFWKKKNLSINTRLSLKLKRFGNIAWLWTIKLLSQLTLLCIKSMLGRSFYIHFLLIYSCYTIRIIMSPDSQQGLYGTLWKCREIFYECEFVWNFKRPSNSINNNSSLSLSSVIVFQ